MLAPHAVGLRPLSPLHHCLLNARQRASSTTAPPHFPAHLTARAQVSEAATGYWTLAQPVQAEVEVKKSRFVVTAWPASSGSQALQLIKSGSDPAASHNCYAYRLGGEYRSSDDGEPGGTAGRPILAAIEGEGLDGLAVLVTRYFGGVKLGQGGLVRAYGGAARDCLRAAPRVLVKRQAELLLRCPFEFLGAVYHALDKLGAQRLREEYDDDGTLCVLRCAVEADSVEELAQMVSNATSGQVTPEVLEQVAAPSDSLEVAPDTG